MNQRSKIILISVLSVILGVVCLLTGKSLYKPVVPAQGADPTPTPTVVVYDPTKDEGTAENPFTILEIVPNHYYAQVGFLIDGQEPVKVYGTNGILENAQAGYAGAYDYLQKLTEFTVTGKKGELSGAGNGTGGGVGGGGVGGGSRTIYAFDDERDAHNEAEGIEDADWTRSTDKISRVKGYYTEATSEQKNDSVTEKFELQKVTTTNNRDTSGIDGKVYTSSSELTGFKQPGWYESGDKYSAVRVYASNSRENHRFASGESGVSLARYKVEIIEATNWWEEDKYIYSRDDAGEYIFYRYNNRDYMFYANRNGNYIAVYSTGYYVYKMVSLGTGRVDTSKTYYVYPDAFGYEENQRYLAGELYLNNTIWIDGEAYNDYLDTSNEYYYTYTIEEEAEAYYFADEQVSEVEYNEVGKKDRAYYMYNADAVRGDSAIQKYEYIRMLKTDAAGLGWISAEWSGKGLDGYTYSKSVLKRFVLATGDETPKYDRPSDFVLAVDSNDKGSNGARYEQMAAEETTKIVGTKEDFRTYTYVTLSTEYSEKPDGWTTDNGPTYDYEFKYVSAANFGDGKYTIPDSTNVSDLWFVTFSESETGNYSPVGEGYRLNGSKDNSNNYFYEKNGGAYSLAATDYTGNANGRRRGFIITWWEDNDYYLVTFTKDDSTGSYEVSSAVPYASTGNGNTINQMIASMLYTKEETYTKLDDASGQYIKSEGYYKYDANGDYTYYNGHLYKKKDRNATAADTDYVLYKAQSGQGNGSNYYYFKNPDETEYNFYRINPSGNYVAEYDFQQDASGEYIYWLRPVNQSYVNANSGTTFYYWKGLTYAENQRYSKSSSFRSEIEALASWGLTKTEAMQTYFAVKPAAPGVTVTPVPEETVGDITITHSNVFLKNVMNFAYQGNDPTKPLEIDRFEFGGWYTEAACINKFDFENTVLNANIELFAKWIPKTGDDNVFVSDLYKKAYTVKFYAKDGAAEAAYVVESNAAELELSNVTYVPEYAKEDGDKKDYLFQGWKKADGTVVTEIKYEDVATGGEVKLYPVWKVMEVTGGKVMDVTDAANKVEVTATHTVKFYVTKDGATSVVKTLEVFENGYIKTVDEAAVSDKYLKSFASLTPEAQDGKKFVGWYTETTPKFATHTPYNFNSYVTEDVALYACWVEEAKLGESKYVVKLNDNQGSIAALLLDAENQKVDLSEKEIKYAAFKDGELENVKPLSGNITPSLKGNVQYKAFIYKVEVKTVLPSELNNLSADELEELLSRADMIVVSNSNNHGSSSEADYSSIFANYANKKGGTNGYTTSNDLSFSVASAIMKKSLEPGSAPVLLDKALLNAEDRLNAKRLFIMLQSMDAGMFYDSFVKSNATDGTGLWKRLDASGKFNGSAYWGRDTLISALGLSQEEKAYYGIDTSAEFSVSGYPVSLTNHCFVYSGEMFSNGSELTKNVIAKNDFYTANMFNYFTGKKAAVGNKYAPADAVNYMVFGYTPAPSLDETTSFLEIQPTQTFEDMKFWYLYVKKFMPTYSGKLIVKHGNSNEEYFYLGTAEAEDYKNTLTIEQMSSAQFVGKLCDLSGNYRMIYLGLKEMSSTLSSNAEYTAPFVSNGSGGYYYYFHTGKTVTISADDYQGQLSTDGISDFIDTYAYPGNDFTMVKCNALIEFCKKAKLPVVLDNRFYNGTDINTSLIDNSTYLYQALKYGTVYAPEAANASAAEANGLIKHASCFKYGDTSRNAELKTILNQPNLRIVYGSSSDVPPEYTVLANGIATGYLNPNHETERVLTYNFYLQGVSGVQYDVRMFIDMNADGKYTEATEKLDSLVIYDQTSRRYLSKYDSMEAGHYYTVKRSINDYVGILPWKLEVFEKANPVVHYAITGMTAIKTTKQTDEGTWEKEKLNILQICSGGKGTNLGKTTVFLPAIKDIEEALGSKKDSDDVAYADYTFDDFTENQKNLIRNEMGSVTYMYWTYLASLEDFDVEITRINDGSDDGLQGLYNAIAADPLYLENYNMLVIGFADCYNDIRNDATLRAIEDFIASGKSVLFTHDTTSLNNLKETTGGRSRSYTDWGYHINRYFRNTLGMDRYGSTLIYDHDGEDHTEEMEKKDKVYLAGTGQANEITAVDTKIGGTLQERTKELVHGYTRWELYKNQNRTTGTNKTTNSATKINDGQITRYPYVVGDTIDVATTHSQYYQLDLESDDIVVWYCLGGSSYANYYNDATNFYYIYNKGNITYTGVGHNGSLDEDEAKLFVNTMVAAYMASADPTAPQIINFDRTTGTDKVDYLYVDYDTTHPELAIGEGVEGDELYTDASGKIIGSNQTKDVNFRLQENSIVTNKLMTMYVYKLLTAGTPNIYETTPMEMVVRRYTGEDTTEIVRSIPVFIVTQVDNYSDKNDEYVYTPGQVLAIDDNKIHGSGSSCYIKIGAKESDGYFTATTKADTNGYYITDATVAVYPQVGVDGSGEPTYSSTPAVKGRIFMAPVVEAGEEYMFKAPISGLVNKDMIPYQLHVNLRYGKRQDKSKDGYKELSVVRRGLFNLD